MQCSNRKLRNLSYDKSLVLQDLAAGELKPVAIAAKHEISVGNVYAIKAQAVKAGVFPAKRRKWAARKFEDTTVFTPELRERIKDLREQEFTTSEIAVILECSIQLPYEEARELVSRVKSRTERTGARLMPPVFKPTEKQERVNRLARAGCSIDEVRCGMLEYNLSDREVEELFAYAQRSGKLRG